MALQKRKRDLTKPRRAGRLKEEFFDRIHKINKIRDIRGRSREGRFSSTFSLVNCRSWFWIWFGAVLRNKGELVDRVFLVFSGVSRNEGCLIYIRYHIIRNMIYIA